MPDNIDFKQALKATHWEMAKGHLRAMVAVEGSVHSDQLAHEGRFKFEVISEHFDDFIKFIEKEELNL